MAIDVSIVSSGHDVGDARLHRLTSALASAGLSVQVMATGSPDYAPTDAVTVTTAPRGGLKRRIVRAVMWPLRASGKVIFVIDPDAVPSAWLATRRGRRLIVDVHEDYRALTRDRAWAEGFVGIVIRLVLRIVTLMSARADLTVVADEHVPPRRCRARFVLKNTPYPAHLPQPSEPDTQPRALYVGDLRTSRGLFDMLDAIEEVSAWRLDLVGPVSRADQAEFIRRIESPALSGRVRWYGRRPPEQSWAFASGAWVGLSLLHDTPAFREAIPSKVYEFISCGLPVIASNLPRQAALVASLGVGAVVSTHDEIVESLRRYEHDPVLLAAHRQLARQSSFVNDEPYREFGERVKAMVRSS